MPRCDATSMSKQLFSICGAPFIACSTEQVSTLFLHNWLRFGAYTTICVTFKPQSGKYAGTVAVILSCRTEFKPVYVFEMFGLHHF